MTAHKGSFEAALERNEIDLCFRGKGDYFYLNRDWGGHLYIMQIFGIFVDVSKQRFSFSLFENAFAPFIDTLSNSDEDIEVFWCNTHAFYSCFLDPHTKLDTQFFSDVFARDPCKASAISFFSRAPEAKQVDLALDFRARFPKAALQNLY